MKIKPKRRESKKDEMYNIEYDWFRQGVFEVNPSGIVPTKKVSINTLLKEK